MVPCAIIVPASAHLRIPAHSRLSLRRGRRPQRSVRFSSKGRDVSRSGATSFCPRRQKDAKTPPKTYGLWISFRLIATAVQKGPQRIACTPIPAAAPTSRRIMPYPTADKPADPCTEHGSGSDKRTASDSLYGDLCHVGSRVVQRGRFSAHLSRAGSLETCGFKQRFWPLLGLRPKVARARGHGTFPFRCRKKWGRRRE